MNDSRRQGSVVITSRASGASSAENIVIFA